jgi:hypothetical protein
MSATTIRSLLAATAALAALALPGAAQAQTRVGVLECRVGAGVGMIITSSKALSCRFRPARGGGVRDRYVGTVRRFGLDIGATRAGAIVWAVFAPSSLGRGALAGTYVGASAEATVGAGLGANVLVGGSNRTISLQPLSVQAQTGLNIAAGVGEIDLVRAR